MPEAIALTTGTPTLVVPHSLPCREVGKRVLVAWNGSRDAAHAIGSAMPLLDVAESIVVLNGTTQERFVTVTQYTSLDLRRRPLAHCSVVEVVEFMPPSGEEGAQILAAAKEYDCDVIVMGAYGQSRVRELLLGGATRHVFRHMDRPVLFAH